MTHGGSLTGQIVDVENKPVAGAEITTFASEPVDGNVFELFAALEPRPSRRSSSPRTQTDASGSKR